MTIEHDFFGILGSDDDGEVYWSDQAELGDQSIDIDLSAPDEESVSVEALDIAASMIGALEELDSRAKESLVAELSTEGSPTLQYIQLALDEIGADSLEEAIIWDSGDKQIDFLRSLQLQRVGLRPHHTGDEQHFAVMDYSISPDDTDSLLVVSLDVNGDTVSVALES
jgi:hypothetical protein